MASRRYYVSICLTCLLLIWKAEGTFQVDAVIESPALPPAHGPNSPDTEAPGPGADSPALAPAPRPTNLHDAEAPIVGANSPRVAPAPGPNSRIVAPKPGSDLPGVAPTPGPVSPGGVFDVRKYGAVADGKTENNLAFSDAWAAACSYEGNSTILIPQGTFFISPIKFEGPCHNNQSPKVEMRGTLKAPLSMDDFSPYTDWITFKDLSDLNLSGTGTGVLDGQGDAAWTQADCRRQGKCDSFPTTLRFIKVLHGSLSGITLLNSKSFHIGFSESDDFLVHDINITAPENSPNTDGIHTSDSSNINITSSKIGVGDDCISVGPGSVNISVSNINCGPGHGISVGSLGKYPNEKEVVGLRVTNCTFNGTDNGVRIKTWPGATANRASNITFENLIMNNASNPIIIDQEYCPSKSCDTKPSLVKLTNIHFKNITGTSNTKSAVSLVCSSKAPCENVLLVDINLNYTKADGNTTSTCLNVKGVSSGIQIPTSCI